MRIMYGAKQGKDGLARGWEGTHFLRELIQARGDWYLKGRG